MANPLEAQWTRDGSITEKILDFVTFNEFLKLTEAGGFDPQVQKAIEEIRDNIHSLYEAEDLIKNANRAIQLMTEKDANRMVFQRHLADLRRIRLQVQLQNGRGVEVAVEPHWKILRLKALLQQKTEINRSNQRLFFGTRVLEDLKTLQAELLGNGSTLTMRIVESPEFVVFVQGADHTRNLLTIRGLRPESRVRDLLAKIEAQVGRQDAYLTYGGHRLEESETLKHYGIQSESTVHFQRRMRGG